MRSEALTGVVLAPSNGVPSQRRGATPAERRRVQSAAGGAVRTTRTPAESKARPHATSDLHIAYFSPATGTELTTIAKVGKAR